MIYSDTISSYFLTDSERKTVNPVRKTLLLLLVLFLTLVCACAAADEYTLEGISGKMTLDESTYIVLTAENLSSHPDMLKELGTDAETLKKDFEERSVVLKAWTKDLKTSIEVTVVQDEDSARYYDLELQNNSARKQYYKEQLAAYKSRGYNVSDSEIKLHAKSGHYAVFNYSFKDNDTTRRGIMRKTVRNGYTLTVDYEVFDRRPTKTDKDKGRKFINGIVIDAVEPKGDLPSGKPASGTGSASSGTASSDDSALSVSSVPSGAASTLKVSTPPPTKTNSGTFTIEGTAYPGSKLIFSAPRLNSTSSDSYTVKTVTTKGGKFKAKIALPAEGVYYMTLTMEVEGNPTLDLGKVEYKKTFLPITMDAQIPEEITTDELVISGVTVKNVSIQCLVTNGITTFDKSIKTNGTGKFKFKVPTAVEAEYEIVLSFQKKDLNSERLTFKTTRVKSTQETKKDTTAKAIHPAYNLLTKKISSYIGKTMVYTAHIVSVEQKGDDWLIIAALKLNKGKYSNFLYYTADHDPGLMPGSKVKLYGICQGPYQNQAEEEDTEDKKQVAPPDFDFLYAE